MFNRIKIATLTAAILFASVYAEEEEEEDIDWENAELELHYEYGKMKDGQCPVRDQN